MEPEIQSKSLFDQIIEHTLDSLQASGNYDSTLLQSIRKLANDEQLAKPASLMRIFKTHKEADK